MLDVELANKSQTTVAFIETEKRRVMVKLIKHTCVHWFKNGSCIVIKLYCSICIFLLTVNMRCLNSMLLWKIWKDEKHL